MKGNSWGDKAVGGPDKWGGRSRGVGAPDYLLKRNSIDVQLLLNVVLISAAPESDSVIHIYILFHILFHSGLSQTLNTVPCGLQ